MIFLLISSWILGCASHPISDKFVSLLSRLDVDFTPNEPVHSPEMTRLAANMFAAGLRAHDSRSNLPPPKDCPNFVDLAVSFAMHHVVKSSCNHIKFTKPVDETLYSIVQTCSCSRFSLGAAREVGLKVAIDLVHERLNDEFISFFLPGNSFPNYLSEKLKANSSFLFGHYANYKMNCFSEADPKKLFPIHPAPNINSPDVAVDWNDYFHLASITPIPPKLKTKSQIKIGEFWISGAVGDGSDEALSTGGQFLIFARHLVNKHCDKNLRKTLQFYTIISTALSNADKAAWSYQQDCNCWPTELITRGYPGRHDLRYKSTWKSLVSSVPMRLKEMPTYPNADSAVSKCFSVIASQLFPSHQSISAYSKIDEVVSRQKYSDTLALHDDFTNGMLYGGVSWPFALRAGAELGARVCLATFNMLMHGQCPSHYANQSHKFD